ncbi:MAG: hypothetical protein LLH30_11140 [Candidatus Manganitrophus sp. SA1]|nr:hypothetical protein [Candidatus Manganitrophus morganii]
MKRVGLWLAAAMTAGLIGGVLSVWIFNVGEAFARKASKEKRVVTAEDFHLVDDTGKLRGALFVSAKGEPGFALFDKEGKDRILLMLNADGSTSIELHDQAGESRAKLALGNDGSPTLSLAGDPVITLLDREKKVLWKAP